MEGYRYRMSMRDSGEDILVSMREKLYSITTRCDDFHGTTDYIIKEETSRAILDSVKEMTKLSQEEIKETIEFVFDLYEDGDEFDYDILYFVDSLESNEWPKVDKATMDRIINDLRTLL